MNELESRIRHAWQGRVSGCQLGKPVELMSMRKGYDALATYLEGTGKLPLRDYIEYRDDASVFKASCKGHMQRSEPDDDINYSVIALLLLEAHGRNLRTIDVAQIWLKLLPAAQTFTAERAAYRTLLACADEWFAERGDPDFDLKQCADNPYNRWIGAQIRADVYGWVCPGDPALAAELAQRDASLSHVEEGVHGAVFVAALGAALAEHTPEQALAAALEHIPAAGAARAAVDLGMSQVGNTQGGAAIRARYAELSPVHTLNNLAIVVWALYSHLDDFSAAIGSAVSAGLDTDCNGATVGGLWGLQGGAIPAHWIEPWQGRIGLGLAGYDEVRLEALVERTVAVAQRITQRTA